MSDVVSAMSPYRKTLAVAKGRYYLVVDNAKGGAQRPLLDDRAALVNYAVQVGDAP